MNKSTKHFNGTPQARARRERVVKLLEAQLKSGIKNYGGNPAEPLTDDDVKRINKELEIIKTRI